MAGQSDGRGWPTRLLIAALLVLALSLGNDVMGVAAYWARVIAAFCSAVEAAL